MNLNQSLKEKFILLHVRSLIYFLILFPFFSCISKFSDKTNLALFLGKVFFMDNSGPFVNFTSPDVVDNEFELNKAITVVFNEKIKSYTASPIQVSNSEKDIPGQWSISSSALIFTPSSDLPANSELKVIIFGVQDNSDNKMSELYQYKFKTGTTRDTSPIKVQATDPEENSPNVFLNRQIIIEFNDTLHPDSAINENFVLTEADTGALVESIIDLQGTKISIQPKVNFKKSTRYSLTIKSTIKDTAGNIMGSDYTLQFLSGTDTDNTKPKVTTYFPTGEIRSSILDSSNSANSNPERALIEANTFSPIYPNEFLIINFSEPINRLNIDKVIEKSNFYVLKKSDSSVITVGARTGIASLIVFPQTGKWVENSEYVLVIKSNVSDTSSNLMGDEFRLNFRTTQTPSVIVPPELASNSPANNATNIGLNVKLKITFTKPIFRPSVTIDSIFIKDTLGVVTQGTYTFEDFYTVIFRPSSLLKSNMQYTGTIKTNVKGMGNEKLNTEYSFSFNTETATAPVSLMYGSRFYPLNRNIPVSPITPSYEGYISSCSISPSLPAGLYLLSANCSIYGNPQKLSNTTVYTITATNPGGSTYTNISLSVTEPDTIPLYVGYAPTEYKLVKDSPSSIYPSSMGQIKTCSIEPALPSGLTISSNCTISGTPTVFSSAVDYTVTAKNDNETTKGALTISVNSSSTLDGTITVNASVANTTVWEGIGNLPVTISLSQSPASIVGVDYTTQNATAIAGTDYTLTSGTVYFRAGETSKVVNVPIINDAIYEGTESFIFKLTTAVGDTSNLGTSQLNLTISDIDINNGLIIYYPFNGNAVDTIRSETANFTGSPLLIADRKGNANSAYDLNGGDNRIKAVSNVGITGNVPRTLSTWFKFPATNPASIQHPVNWGANPVVSTRSFGFFSLSGNINFYGETAGDIFNVTPITTNWEHWVAVYDSTNVYVYKNGVLQTQAAKALNTGDSPLEFGRRMDGGWIPCVCAVDDTRVYSRAMDADEVRSLYEIEK